MAEDNSITNCLGRGYYRDFWTCKCFTCVERCNLCSSATTCWQCDDGYTLNADGQCAGIRYILDLEENSFSSETVSSFTFVNAPSQLRKINYQGKDYLGGVDSGRVAFSKTYQTPKAHWALVINFMLLEFPGLNPLDRLNLYADGLFVYSHDPTSYSGYGPEAESIQIYHNKPSVTLTWVSEDRTIAQPQSRILPKVNKSQRILQIPGNIAYHTNASQSSTTSPFVASLAVDGTADIYYQNPSTCALTEFRSSPSVNWWKTDLGSERSIDVVRLFSANSDNVYSSRFFITIGNDPNIENNALCDETGSKTGNGYYNCQKKGRYIGVYQTIPSSTSYRMRVCEVEAYENQPNVAFGAQATQSSTYGTNNALKAVDKNSGFWITSDTCAITSSESNPWWYAILPQSHDIKIIRIVPLGSDYNKLSSYRVRIGNNPDWTKNPECPNRGPFGNIACPLSGRYISVEYLGVGSLSICSFEAFSDGISSKNYAIRDINIEQLECPRQCRACFDATTCAPAPPIIRDLDYKLNDEHTFQNEILHTPWSYGGLTIGIFESICGTRPWLGGYNVWKPQGWFQRTWIMMPPHYKIRIEFDLLIVDQFSSYDDYLVVYEVVGNNQFEVFKYKPIIGVSTTNLQNLPGYSHICGNNTKLDKIERVAFEFIHISSSLTLKWVSSTSVAESTAAFGISQLFVYFYDCYAWNWWGGCNPISGSNNIFFQSSEIYQNTKNDTINTKLVQATTQAIPSEDHQIVYLISILVILSVILILAVILVVKGFLPPRSKMEFPKFNEPQRITSEVEVFSKSAP